MQQRNRKDMELAKKLKNFEQVWLRVIGAPDSSTMQSSQTQNRPAAKGKGNHHKQGCPKHNNKRGCR